MEILIIQILGKLEMSENRKLLIIENLSNLNIHQILKKNQIHGISKCIKFGTFMKIEDLTNLNSPQNWKLKKFQNV